MNFDELQNLKIKDLNSLDIFALEKIKIHLDNTINLHHNGMYSSIFNKNRDSFKKYLALVPKSTDQIMSLFKDHDFYGKLESKDIPFLEDFISSTYFHALSDINQQSIISSIFTHTLHNPAFFNDFKKSVLYSEKEMLKSIEDKMTKEILHSIDVNMYIYVLKEYKLSLNHNELHYIIAEDKVETLSKLFEHQFLNHIIVNDEFQDTLISIALNSRATNMCEYLLNLFPRQIDLDYFCDDPNIENLLSPANTSFFHYILETIPLTKNFITQIAPILFNDKKLPFPFSKDIEYFTKILCSHKDESFLDHFVDVIEKNLPSNQDTIETCKFILQSKLQKMPESHIIEKKIKI